MDELFRIRSGLPADARALALLERECFGDPWTAASFREALATDVTVALLAEGPADDLLGYFIGHQAAGAGEVLNLAVARSARRRGVGRALLQAGLRQLSTRGAEEVFLEVRESNAGARALYEEFGFRPVGLRPDYYRSPREDAIVLRLGLVRAAKG